ncbi:MAG: ATP-binding cassette domain-containing protein, partial [Candidatus Eremiobacteraeota bacterium]|nr:ATP-binding cassette domain-containing protein [Candidatus Eremiobacteraeota bacterium]
MSALPVEDVPTIELVGVSRRFVTPGGTSLTALRDFDMTVRRGEFVAVVGPTGCGKSTLLNVGAGLLQPSSGTVSVFGEPLAGLNRRAGYMFQADALMPWRSAIDNVVAGLSFHDVPRD